MTAVAGAGAGDPPGVPAAAVVPPAFAARPVARAASLQWLAALQLAGLVLVQVFHQGEHTLELLGRRLGVEGAAPLLSGLDFEWIHLVLNTVLFLAAGGVLATVGAAGRAAWRSAHRVAYGALAGVVALQGAHVAEHVVRIVQYVGGADPPPGLATRALDVVWFHWAVNLVFLAGLVAGLVGLGLHRILVGLPARR